jgi:hypothetical protein
MISRALDTPVTWRGLLAFHLALIALDVIDTLGGAYLRGFFGLP